MILGQKPVQGCNATHFRKLEPIKCHEIKIELNGFVTQPFFMQRNSWRLDFPHNKRAVHAPAISDQRRWIFRVSGAQWPTFWCSTHSPWPGLSPLDLLSNSMADPLPLSKEDTTCSFGDDLDLSLSLDGKSFSAKEKQVDTGLSRPELERRASSMRKGPPRLSGGSVHFNPDHVNVALPYDSTRPVSDATYSSSNIIPYAESSKSPPPERDLGDGTEEPSDYDIFLKKSREEYERDKQRNWPTVEIEDASFTNSPSSTKNADRRKLFATVRKILRILQLVTRYRPPREKLT